MRDENRTGFSLSGFGSRPDTNCDRLKPVLLGRSAYRDSPSRVAPTRDEISAHEHQRLKDALLCLDCFSKRAI